MNFILPLFPPSKILLYNTIYKDKLLTLAYNNNNCISLSKHHKDGVLFFENIVSFFDEYFISVSSNFSKIEIKLSIKTIILEVNSMQRIYKGRNINEKKQRGKAVIYLKTISH